MTRSAESRQMTENQPCEEQRDEHTEQSTQHMQEPEAGKNLMCLQ